jgi:hypothetical protein
MKRYYRARLEGIPELPRHEAFPESRTPRLRKRPSISWEDAAGFALTAAYFMQFFLPDRWFLIGRIVSVFRIGF